MNNLENCLNYFNFIIGSKNNFYHLKNNSNY